MKNDGRRVNTPAWLTDPEELAPCPCGDPQTPDIPTMVVEDPDTGLQRWWHAPCLYRLMMARGMGMPNDED